MYELNDAAAQINGQASVISKEMFMVKAGKVPDGNRYTMKISGFKNPFSMKGQMEFAIRYFPQCNIQAKWPNQADAETAINNINCYKMKNGLKDVDDETGNTDCLSSPMLWTNIGLRDMYTLHKAKAAISPGPDKTENEVGSTDGYITFTFPPTDDFPIYGGVLIFRVPNWFTGDEPESTFHAGIRCEKPTGAEYLDDVETSCQDRAGFAQNADKQ